VFFVQKDGCMKKKILHQILSDHHPSTFSKTKKKGLVVTGMYQRKGKEMAGWC